MTTYEYLAGAAHLELLAAEIYAGLAEQFRGTPELCDTFRRLADEELQHAQRIRLLAAQYRFNAALFVDLLTLGDQLAAALTRAQETLGEIRRGAWGRDAAAITARLAELEGHFAHVHAEEMTRGAAPAVAQFFRALARQDRAHQQLLRDAPVRPQAGRDAAAPRDR